MNFYNDMLDILLDAIDEQDMNFKNRKIGYAIKLVEGHKKHSAMSDRTLRDWFAGMALAHVRVANYDHPSKLQNTPEDLAIHAYKIADAMIKAREEK